MQQPVVARPPPEGQQFETASTSGLVAQPVDYSKIYAEPLPTRQQSFQRRVSNPLMVSVEQRPPLASMPSSPPQKNEEILTSTLIQSTSASQRPSLMDNELRASPMGSRCSPLPALSTNGLQPPRKRARGKCCTAGGSYLTASTSAAASGSGAMSTNDSCSNASSDRADDERYGRAGCCGWQGERSKRRALSKSTSSHIEVQEAHQEQEKLETIHEEDAFDLTKEVRKLLFNVRGAIRPKKVNFRARGNNDEGSTSATKELLPTYSVSYKNYPVIWYNEVVPCKYKSFFRPRAPPL